MNLRKSGKFTAAVLLGVAFALFCVWFSGTAYKADYLEAPAYIVEGVTEPRVDLTALRRNWPAALGAGAERAQLIGYMREIPEAGAGDDFEDSVEIVLDLETLLSQADLARGERASGICAACHTLQEGGPTVIGPNLWNLVGRGMAKMQDFNYSNAMAAREGTWTFEELDTFLASPMTVVTGTTMAFAGVPDASERADLIAFLSTLNDNPPPLPEAPAGLDAEVEPEPGAETAQAPTEDAPTQAE